MTTADSQQVDTLGGKPPDAAKDKSGALNAPPQKPVDWVARHQSAAVIVAFVLILLYALPLFIVAIAAYQSDWFQEPNAWFAWFAAFMKTSDSTLNGVHKVLFPFISTLSIIAFKDKINFSVIGLGVCVLGMFMLSVFVGVLFDMDQTATAIENLPDDIDINTARSFFSKTQDTLLMYLMLLLGVSAISSPAGKTGNPS